MEQDWVLIRAALGNLTAHLSNSQEATALAMPNFGIPLTGSMSAGFAVGFMKG
ncbi:MAG: hypothetical protein M3297_02860 [Thermoproteota archaeon]|nr:hypothetical protein [Thermoproteota archaeon]